MKVLQVINSLDTGGAEKQLIELIPKFIAVGLEVDLILLNDMDFPLKKLLVKNSAVKVIGIGKGNLYNPFLVFRMIPFLKKYDIIHVHLFPSLYWVAISKMLSASKPVLIYTEHNTSNRRRNRLLSFLDRMIYKRYKKIITISDEVDHLLKQHLKFDDSKFSLIKNGLDIEKIYNVEPNELSDIVKNKSDRIIVQVASFTKQKDQQTLIRAIPKINFPVSVLMIGKGPTLNECKQLSREIGVEEKVHFLGIRMDVPALLKASDIVVLSSHYEGLSLSSIEGLASGKPFVASDAPGLKDIVKGAGLLFNIGDEKGLANHINKLLEDRDLYSAIAEKCVNRSLDYHIDRNVDQHIELYKELCPNQN
jgi:glycosyltransferase involved in cell wall biosynthesis